jgi:5-methylcytosine-specific restriction endonuclease McrA
MAITPQYQAYLNSSEWRSKRLKVLQRAKFKCEQCKKKQATQIHHKSYRHIFNEPLSDLLAVCATCHREIHGIKEKPKKRRKIRVLGQILAKVIR